VIPEAQSCGELWCRAQERGGHREWLDGWNACSDAIPASVRDGRFGPKAGEAGTARMPHALWICRRGVKVCKISLAGGSIEHEEAARRALAVKARWWIADYPARAGSRRPRGSRDAGRRSARHGESLPHALHRGQEASESRARHPSIGALAAWSSR
jgi:hypothetical protein